MATTIYALCDPVSEEVRYIGKAKNPAKRLYEHILAAKKGGRLHCSRWIKSIGFNPLMKIVTVVVDELASETEIKTISDFRARGERLTNLTDGGEGVCGHRHSPETRATMSAKAKARIPRRGFVFAPHSLQKMRLAKLGKKQSPEHIAKVVKAMTGHAVSQETRGKLSAAHRGRCFSTEHKAKLSAWQIGRIIPVETRSKMSESHRKRWKARRASMALSAKGAQDQAINQAVPIPSEPNKTAR